MALTLTLKDSQPLASLYRAGVHLLDGSGDKVIHVSAIEGVGTLPLQMKITGLLPAGAPKNKSGRKAVGLLIQCYPPCRASLLLHSEQRGEQLPPPHTHTLLWPCRNVPLSLTGAIHTTPLGCWLLTPDRDKSFSVDLPSFEFTPIYIILLVNVGRL